MKPEPFVSILLPIYNAQGCLENCVKSLLAQSYKHIEIIAIDDNSKDNSYTILKGFKKKNSRLRMSRNKKRYGLAICLNRALKKAKGTYIALMDQNDVSTPDRIRRQVHYLLSHPKVVVVGTQSDKVRVPTDHDAIVKSILLGETLQFETAMINKQLLPKDLLCFQQNAYPFLFGEVFVKLMQYGEFANLPWILQHRRKLADPSTQALQNLPSFLKHLVKSIALYDYRPSFRSLFFPAIKQI